MQARGKVTGLLPRTGPARSPKDQSALVLATTDTMRSDGLTPGARLQGTGQCRVKSLLLRVAAALLGHLDDDHAVAALEAQPSVLGDQPPGPVFMDDLVPVSCRGCEHLHHDVLDCIRQRLYFLVASSLDDIYTNQGHGVVGPLASQTSCTGMPSGKCRRGHVRRPDAAQRASTQVLQDAMRSSAGIRCCVHAALDLDEIPDPQPVPRSRLRITASPVRTLSHVFVVPCALRT